MESDCQGSLMPSKVNKGPYKRQKVSNGQENLVGVGTVSTVKPSSLHDDRYETSKIDDAYKCHCGYQTTKTSNFKRH